MRIGALNHKGFFTRERKPKLVAHRTRTLWSKPAKV
jgi:beta-glucuronidase